MKIKGKGAVVAIAPCFYGKCQDRQLCSLTALYIKEESADGGFIKGRCDHHHTWCTGRS